MRRCQQSVHQSFECIGTRVLDKLIDLVGRRRKSEQIEGSPADQYSLFGFCGHRRIFGGKISRIMEIVDRLMSGIGRCDEGNGDVL